MLSTGLHFASESTFPSHEFLQDLEKMNLRALAIEHQGTLPTSYYSELVNIPHRAGVVLGT
jgi:hypothetical protein